MLNKLRPEESERTHVPKMLVEALYVSVHNLERVQLVLTRRHATHEI